MMITFDEAQAFGRDAYLLWWAMRYIAGCCKR